MVGSVKSNVYLISSSPWPVISRFMFVSIIPPSCEKVSGTAKTPSNSAESFNSPGVGISYTTNWLENETPYEIFADKAGTIKESIKLNIPIIAILDTNSNPEGIDYPIPGNDDARRSIDLYCSLIKETIENAKKEAPKIEDKKIIEKPKKQENFPPKKKLN